MSKSNLSIEERALVITNQQRQLEYLQQQLDANPVAIKCLQDGIAYLQRQQKEAEEGQKTRALLMCGQCGCPLEWCVCPENEL